MAKTRKIYTCTPPLNENEIREINDLQRLYGDRFDLIFRYASSKGIDPNALRRLNPDVQIAISGGVNPKKQKYNDIDYFERTLYYPEDLVKIIEEFEKIERGIDLSWTDLQKAIYVYKTLAEHMHYVDHGVGVKQKDGTYRDPIRTYRNVLTRKSTCAGFAILYKELMDRLNIPCDYVNKIHRHDWNVLQIDGEYIPVDLSDDCCYTHNKFDGTCQFCAFGRDNFYNLPNSSRDGYHHEVLDPEEYDHSKSGKIRYLSADEIVQNLQVIGAKKKFEKQYKPMMLGDLNVRGLLFDFNNGYYNFAVNYNNRLAVVTLNTEEMVNFGSSKKITKSEKIDKFREYRRSDGSIFFIYPALNGKNMYNYLEPSLNGLKFAHIQSEMDLYNAPESLNDSISNVLLSSERIKRKINNFNGYVGYLRGGALVSNKTHEEDLNIYRK